MNDLTLNSFSEKPIQLEKLEFWAATTIYVFAVFFLSTSSFTSNSGLFEEARIPFNYYRDYFFPELAKYTTLYLAILLFNFKIVPKLIRRESIFQNIFLIVISFVVIGLVFGIADTYAMNYLFNKYNDVQETYNAIFLNSFRCSLWLLLMFGFYSVVKFLAFYIISNSEAIQSKYSVLTREILIGIVIWMVCMFLVMLIGLPGVIIAGWAIVIPIAIALYCFSFSHLIPKILGKKNPFRNYLFRASIIIILSILPVIYLVMLLVNILLLNCEAEAIGLGFFNAAFQMLVTVPLSWDRFKRQMQGNEELFVLKNELGKSNANLDFLRSQINPHFLFNALNTLYGTALQENNDRTARGIQMLGDMMRFMLHENLQQKILLSREIEYMRNYIDLQLLRTSLSKNIQIYTKIEDVVNEKFIAPMLLIPFVENAFKHGISLKRKSWISVTLRSDRNKLYFAVNNSVHAKREQDPEKDKSGVGLNNVKQRLALLYPDKHDLIIRETAEEYFVKLTLEL